MRNPSHILPLPSALLALLLAAFPLAGQSVAPDEVLVSGHLIDVRGWNLHEPFFPQNRNVRLTPAMLSDFEPGTRYACSLMENRGPEMMMCGRDTRCLIALDTESLRNKKWKYTGKAIIVAPGISYFAYELKKFIPDEWIEIPYPSDCSHTALVLARKIRVDGTADFGQVLCKVPALRVGGVYNQTITMLPDGTYVAACSVTGEGVLMFRSRDKGATWTAVRGYDNEKQKIVNFFNLFVHNGDLYFCGVGEDHRDFMITKSTDGGDSWTSPEDENTGILLRGRYHTAPVPVLISGGRIWRACETLSVTGKDKCPFVMSAPVGADLLKASSWTRTNTVGKGMKRIEGVKMTGSLIEGNAVEAPDGSVANLIRTNSTKTSTYATILHVGGIDSLYFNPQTDWVKMPGGGKKFTVRFDRESGLYWSITNPTQRNQLVMHQGDYAKGMSHSLIRNSLVLICSPDLKNWKEVKTLMYDPDCFFHGFQYADWVIDGEDLAVVVRVAAPESRGLPSRQHDSNMMSFVKVENFRNLAAE